jgi:DNA-binding transcriptional MerR regulator
MRALLVSEASRETGWSARMLHYIERHDLVVPRRSPNGYRIYESPELELLRRLRELRERFHFELSDVRFALRLRREPDLRHSLDAWIDSRGRTRAAYVDWQQWEQHKHQRLLAERNVA